MKKIVLTILILFALCFIFSGCQSNADNESSEAPEITEEQIIDEQPQEENSEEQDSQDDITNQQTLEYLSLMGLDESCNYQLNDTFPSSVNDKKMYLITVNNITEEDFDAIENKLQENGFIIVSDIKSDDEKQTRSYPYSNNESLYVEIVFSYGAEYFDVTFTPTS